MSEESLLLALERMHEAAGQAFVYIEGLDEEMFLSDKRTMDAVTMQLVVIGELAARFLRNHPDFLRQHSEIEWHGMRAFRNRIAHGYFDINYRVVWETVLTALPDLVYRLPAVRLAAEAQADSPHPPKPADGV